MDTRTEHVICEMQRKKESAESAESDAYIKHMIELHGVAWIDEELERCYTELKRRDAEELENEPTAGD